MLLNLDDYINRDIHPLAAPLIRIAYKIATEMPSKGGNPGYRRDENELPYAHWDAAAVAAALCSRNYSPRRYPSSLPLPSS